VKKPVSKFAFQTQPAALQRGGAEGDQVGLALPGDRLVTWTVHTGCHQLNRVLTAIYKVGEKCHPYAGVLHLEGLRQVPDVRRQEGVHEADVPRWGSAG
jgi:hypothetical protein